MSRVTKASLLAGLSAGVLIHTTPIMTGIEINPVAAGALLVLIKGGADLAHEVLTLIADFCANARARAPAGLKGKARWATWRDIKKEISPGWGPYWGAFPSRFGRKIPVLSDFASNALLLGPAGSGKGVGCIQTTTLSIRTSKVLTDFKGELACVLADALRKRGERVRILNIGEMWLDRLGASDTYNPLILIAEDFLTPGGIQDVTGDIHDMSLQLYPEPAEGGGTDDNRYFRDGSRTLIGFVIQVVVLVDGHDATLGDAQQMLNDRAALLHHALWVAGRLPQADGHMAALPLQDSPWVARQDSGNIANYGVYIRGLANSIAGLLQSQDGRTLESFLTGAQQALARFDLTTRAHKYLSSSSFRFADLKDGPPTTVFLVADASRIEAQKDALGLVQWCMTQELKRTETLNTLLSETEIKLLLSGQREPETLKLVEEMLGNSAVVGESANKELGGEYKGLASLALAEDAVSLMTGDEIRRSKKAILFIRACRPMLVETPPIAAIHPFRDQIAINPFHGKPFRKRVRVRMGTVRRLIGWWKTHKETA